MRDLSRLFCFFKYKKLSSFHRRDFWKKNSLFFFNLMFFLRDYRIFLLLLLFRYSTAGWWPCAKNVLDVRILKYVRLWFECVILSKDDARNLHTLRSTHKIRRNKFLFLIANGPTCTQTRQSTINIGRRLLKWDAPLVVMELRSQKWHTDVEVNSRLSSPQSWAINQIFCPSPTVTGYIIRKYIYNASCVWIHFIFFFCYSCPLPNSL